MEAKDTVMNDGEIIKASGTPVLLQVNRAVAEVQAEISFKAGRDSFLDDAGSVNIPLSEARMAGIKEVVDYIENNSTYFPRFSEFSIDNTNWRSKLKEWGL